MTDKSDKKWVASIINKWKVWEKKKQSTESEKKFKVKTKHFFFFEKTNKHWLTKNTNDM